MQDDQFTKLFKYMTERFDTLEAKVDEKSDRTQVQQLQSAVDGIAKGVDVQQVEQAAIKSQLNRQDAWIQQAAPKLKIKYDNGG